MRPGKRGGFNLTFPYTFNFELYLCYGEGEGWGDRKIILFMFYGGGGGGNEDFVDIWGGGGSRIGLVLGVISMQFWALS